jgi:hypothetical protein
MNLQENINRIKEVMNIHEQKNNEVSNQLNWLRSYVKSPQYLERLKKEFPNKDQSFIENEINTRYDNLKDAEYRTHFVNSIGKEPGYISGKMVSKNYRKGDMFYNSKTGKWEQDKWKPDPKGYDKPGHVYMEKEFNPKNWNPYPGYETIPAHEYGHLIDDGGNRIPKETIKKIYDYTKKQIGYSPDPHYKYGNMEFEYPTTPSEFINRMQSVRYLLNKEKIYNPSTNKFTDADYNKMINNPTIKQNDHFQSIMNSLEGNDAQKKKNLIDLMNTVAYQPNNNSQTA